jgi:zinc protease
VVISRDLQQSRNWGSNTMMIRRKQSSPGGRWVLQLSTVLTPMVLGLLMSCNLSHAVEIQRVVSRSYGIEAWLVENHATPVISLEFAFRGGSSFDPPNREGLANLAAALLDKGAGSLDNRAFQQRITDSAIELSFETGLDAFYGRMRTITSYSDEAFRLVQLALTKPRFDIDTVNQIKAAAIADLRSHVTDPDWLASRVMYQVVFPGHPYGRPNFGTADSLSRISIEDLRRFVTRRFAKDVLIIGVAGDITARQLEVVLDKTFGGLPANATLVEVSPIVSNATGTLTFVNHPGSQSTMLLVQSGLNRHDRDYYTAFVMNHILGGSGFNSRLSREARDLRGLTYGIGSQLICYDHANLIAVQSQLSNQNVAEALALIRREWRRMIQEGVTSKELADAKTYLTGSFPLQLSSRQRISSILVYIQLYKLGIDYLELRNNLIEAVTLEDVNRLSSRLLDPESLAVVVVGSLSPDSTLKPTNQIEASVLAERELATRIANN